MSFVKIIDLKNGGVLLEVDCRVEVSVHKNKFIEIGKLSPQTDSIHKSSYSLGEKTMKKMFKKIK